MSETEQQDPAFVNFQAVLKRKSAKTQQNYLWALDRYRKTNFIDQYSFLLEGKIEEIEDKIKAYLGTISHSHASMFLGALQMFYAANRININWKHVLLFAPKDEGAKKLRPYNKDEIEKALAFADTREKVAILLMATSGLRIGALIWLKIEHLHWMNDQGIYCITAYAGDNKDEYMTYCTPQTAELLKKYIDRRKSGPIFVSKVEADYPADIDSLSCAIDELLDRIGVKKPGEVQITHGFRKFFRTVLEVSGVHDDFAERLLGHKKEKLKKVYSQPQPLELYEVSGYSKAIGGLTFNAMV